MGTMSVEADWFLRAHPEITTIEALLPEQSRNFSFGWSGNRATYHTSSIEDTRAFAKNIRFGKVIEVDDKLIRITYSEDNVVPARSTASTTCL